MKDLQSLVKHPSVQGGTGLLLVTGQPVLLVNGAQKKPLGQALANNQIMNWLKASLPVEIMGQFQWGKEVQLNLDVDGAPFPMHVSLRPDRTFQIQIQLQTTPTGEVPATAPPAEPAVETPSAPPEAPPAAEEPRPELSADEAERLDEEVEALARGENLSLIVAAEADQVATLQNLATELGYEPRSSTMAAAVLEVLKYTAYPLILLAPGNEYRTDPVFRMLETMNMTTRRKQFVVLIAPGLKTGDVMLAFSLSVNLVIDEADLTEAGQHILKGLKAWQRYVANLHEALENEGKF